MHRAYEVHCLESEKLQPTQKNKFPHYRRKENARERNSFRIFVPVHRFARRAVPGGSHNLFYFHRNEKTSHSLAWVVCLRRIGPRSARGGTGGRCRDGRAHPVCQPLLQRYAGGHPRRRRGTLQHCLPTRATLRLVGAFRVPFDRRPAATASSLFSNRPISVSVRPR